jgi:uncharacterized protein (DUF2235 family)
MASEAHVESARKPRNIVILSDGTGQRGGLYFDEERTNVYKLYRATRVSPDSNIDPDRQAAFYDPGLGTLPPGGSTPERMYRFVYNFISQATGLGITQNIIDCYAALIRLWQPGDRIFFFGFSRGAYTVRCLATVICLCGIPTTGRNGQPLKRDIASTKKIATRAVKSVYQHVSSPRDAKYNGQRWALAERFRTQYGSLDPKGIKDSSNAEPHFIGVFDTVAALSNIGSLLILGTAYAILHLALARGLSLFFDPYSFGYWFGWVSVWAVSLVVVAYVYTHLKFVFRLRDYHFWDVIHLTTFRQKFYDQYLNRRVKYARHAISIDERCNDFKRVPWGARQDSFEAGERKIDAFEQFWFAGNHADIGGGYPENEARLSDIALQWMVDHATDARLGEDALLVDGSVLHINGRADGMQHDEALSSAFRWAKKTLREPVRDAPLHRSVLERFALPHVQQYDVQAPYRPEALRGHEKVSTYYADIPAPHTTAWQRISALWHRLTALMAAQLNRLCIWLVSFVYPRTWTPESDMDRRGQAFTFDSFVSFLGLLGLALVGGFALWMLLFWQVLPWLRTGEWVHYQLGRCCYFQTSWIGLQRIIDWVMTLPITLLLAFPAILLFRSFGLLSAKIYQCASRAAATTVTPSQTRA